MAYLLLCCSTSFSALSCMIIGFRDRASRRGVCPIQESKLPE
jgi:hypothetical protein